MAPKGNKFWLLRSSHGRKPVFSCPDQLWQASCEYFQWIEENPLEEEKLFAYQGIVTKETVNKMRAMTIAGLCLFLDISYQNWCEYRAKPDFSEVCQKVEAVIYAQKFAGAAADLLNANIIARDLGLRDKSELEVKGESREIRVIEIVGVTPGQLASPQQAIDITPADQEPAEIEHKTGFL